MFVWVRIPLPVLLIKINMNKSFMIQKLEDYLNSTSKEQLEKDWEELKQYKNIGPTMDEYFENLERRFKKPIKKLY